MGNIPNDCDTFDLMLFLNLSLKTAGGTSGEGDPVVSKPAFFVFFLFPFLAFTLLKDCWNNNEFWFLNCLLD